MQQDRESDLTLFQPNVEKAHELVDGITEEINNAKATIVDILAVLISIAVRGAIESNVSEELFVYNVQRYYKHSLEIYKKEKEGETGETR